MNTLTIDVMEAQSQLAKLLALSSQGNKVIITDNEEPVVQLAPVRQDAKRRIAGLHRGAMRMSNDFNVPLPDEFWQRNDIH